MKIFAACFNTETNTFSVMPTGYADFSLTYHHEFTQQPNLADDFGCMGVWKKMSAQHGYDISLSLCAFAQPSGRIVKSVYESLRDEILTDLKSIQNVDVVLLDLHGAMAAEGIDDCEADIIGRVRQIVGSEVVIGVELDLHCHLSPEMIDGADIIISYKEYPHTDINDRAQELFRLAVQTRLGVYRPTMEVFDCKMMGMYPTSSEQMTAFLERLYQTEKNNDVMSVSLVHGFPWGDSVDAGAKLLVVTDNNRSLAKQLAQELGLHFFSLRDNIQFNSLPIDDALNRAKSSSHFPVIVADQSDNPGGGAPSDSTYALQWLIEHGVQPAAVAFIYDPEVVKLACVVGEGANIQVRVGGKMSVHSGMPLDLYANVVSIRKNYQHRFPQELGNDIFLPLGDAAVLRYKGIDIFVTSERCQCFSPCFFEDFNLNPKDYKVIVPKSTQHFYAGFSKISNEIIYMSAPGAIPPDMKLIDYQNMPFTQMYPWNDSPFDESDLKSV